MRFPIQVFALIVCTATTTAAQRTLSIRLPDAQITADRLTRGDGDTYGLGDWQCAFTVKLVGTVLHLNGTIMFTEKANDFTTIVGEYHRRIPVGELEKCRTCQISLSETYGMTSGPNIGARG